MKALLLENIHPEATRILTEAGYEVENRRGALGETELIDALNGVSLLGIRSRTQITERVVAQATDLQAVGAFCIGTNQIDLDAAAREVLPASTLRTATPAASSNWRWPRSWRWPGI